MLSRARIKRSTPGLCLVAILFITVLLYYRGLDGPFVFDDWTNIVPAALTEWDLDKLLSTAAANESGPLGRPVSIVSFSLTSLLLDATPFAHKLTNLILHLLTGSMLFVVLRVIFRTLMGEEDKTTAMALWCCALWLMHPLQVSTVLYGVQRMAILSALFTLLALWLYLRGRLVTADQRHRGYLLILCSFVVATPLAVFSKESGALTLLFMPLLEWIVLQPRNDVTQKKFFRTFWWLGCAAGVIGVIAILSFNSDWLLGNYAIREFSLVERLYTQSHALVFYLGQLCAPGVVELSLFHDDFPVVREPDLITLAAISTLITFAVMIAASTVIHPVVRLGLAWYFIGHLVESTIIPLEMIWEHRNYLAAAGPVMIVVLLIRTLAEKLPGERIQPIALGAVLLLFASLTWLRSGVWSSRESLALHLAYSRPYSVRSQSMLAQTFAARNELEKANEVLSASAEKHPQRVEILMQQLAYNCDRPAVAERLLAKIRRLLKTRTVSNHVMFDLSRLTLIAVGGKCASVSPQAVLETLEALFDNPGLTVEPSHPGILQLLIARNLLAANRTEEALHHYDMAFERDRTPEPWRILLEKARALWQAGRQTEASALRERVLTEFAEATGNLRFQNQLEMLDRLMAGN